MKVILGDYMQEYSVKNKDDENISVLIVFTNTTRIYAKISSGIRDVASKVFQKHTYAEE